jgi:flavin-binding protein dodecin
MWATVDRLIHDLGAIRAFLDEADALAPGSGSPEISSVRGAMDEATTAITRIFADSEDAVVQAAWEAIARAQDAVREARAFMVAARAGRQSAEAMGRLARAQADRARRSAESVTEAAERARRGWTRPPPPVDRPAED